MQLNFCNLRRLIEEPGDPYPKEFFFRTEHNRHLTAYWIKLEGISTGATSAEVRVAARKNRIRITLSGADGITLTLPPFIDRFRVCRQNQRSDLFLLERGRGPVFVPETGKSVHGSGSR